MSSKIKKLKWFSLSLLALLLVYIAVNQIDRPLNPNLSKLLGKNYPAPPDDKNAYYDYVGFYSAAGMDVHKTGEAVIDAYKKSRNRAEFNIKSIPKADSLEIDNEDGFPCRNFTVQTGYCLQDYSQHNAKYGLYLAKNQLAIDRYKSLLESRHFFATTFYIPRTPFTVQPLYLAQVGRSWLQGEKARSITLLTADIRFQRMILADSDLLIYQMISVAALYRDYALLSEMIRQCAACVARHPQINAVLSNLSDEELLMARVMQRELIFSHFHDKLDDNSNLSRYRIYMNHFYPDLLNVGAEKNRLLGLLGYLYLENDTNNHYFEKWKRYIDLGKLKGREFAKRYG